MTEDKKSRRVLEICDQVLMLDDNEREHYLVAACDGDMALRQEIDSLLQAIEDSGSFLVIDESSSGYENDS